MSESNDLLDLTPGIGQVASGVRWYLVSDDLASVIGELHPTSSKSTPSVSHSTSATIMRQVRNVVLRADEAADVNFLSDVVRPTWVLEDGTEWPIGTFWFGDVARTRLSRHEQVPVTLLDGGSLLEVESYKTFGLPANGSIDNALDEVASLAGCRSVNQIASGSRVMEPVAWPSGTMWSQVLGVLCQLVGFFPPHFDALGTLQLRPTNRLNVGLADHVYTLDERSRVVIGSVSESARSLNTPNAHVVVSTGALGGEVYAISYVDAWAPNSVERLGRVKPAVHSLQGIPDTPTAQRIADAYAAAEPVDYTEITFSSPPDPRHGAYDVVEFDGARYRETAWTLPLRPGGEMTHTITRAGAVWAS